MAHDPVNLDDEITGEGGRLVTIAEAKTEFEANLIVSVLRDADIDAFAFDRFRQALPFQSHFTGIPVQVRASDEIAAREALARRAEDSVDIDWDEVDVGDREDRLPSGEIGRMPLAAQIAFSVIMVIILATLFAALLAMLL